MTKPGNGEMKRTTGLYFTMLVGILAVAPATLAVDSDQDGVDDALDVCCDTPAGIAVDDDGRPVGDLDDDCDSDLDDYSLLFVNFGEPDSGMADLITFATFQANFTGDVNAAGACCAASLDPLDDGTELPPGGIPSIIISEIQPGEYIEVFNTMGGDIDLSLAPWQWCVPFRYQTVAVSATVPAGGYVRLDWPAFLTNLSESHGEMILYRDSFFSSSASVLDFVCWGSPSPSRRLTQGAGSGKWSGLCAPSIPPGGAIHRIAATDGTSAASYDVTAPPSPATCVP